ncbi:MAG: hypothetical protein AAF449_06620 [Myxococcota bacterium]
MPYNLSSLPWSARYLPPKAIAAILALSCTVPAARSNALSVASMTPAQVADASHLILIGKIETVQTNDTEGHRYQELVIVPVEVWKGDPPQHLVRRRVTHLQSGSEMMAVSGIAPLTVGQSYLFFFDGTGERARLPLTVGGEQGLFKAVKISNQWRFSDLHGDEIIAVSEARLEINRSHSNRTSATAGEGVVEVLPPERLEPSRSIAATWRALVRRER